MSWLVRSSPLRPGKLSFVISKRGGSVALWLGRWICNPEVPGSNPPACHWMDLCLVVPDSTPPRFVNIQLVSLPPVGIFKKFLFNLQCLFAHFSVLN